MKTEEIIERLRHPQKFVSKTAAQKAAVDQAAQQSSRQNTVLSNGLILVLIACVLAGLFITWMFVLQAKNRAENVEAALDPKQVEGLTYETDFNPSKDVTYIQIVEGTDRNAVVDTLGTTLPIISRYNYQAITPENYKIIGLAPWALTENFAANLQDPDLIRYLLNREEVESSFVKRVDVAPLLEDPQLLAALAQDDKTLNEFFNSDVIQKMLANEQMVRAVGGSRFMSRLLISPAVKYYRDRPQEAVKLINASPALKALTQNPGVRQAVEENRYLKSIAPQLLGTSVQKQTAQK